MVCWSVITIVPNNEKMFVFILCVSSVYPVGHYPLRTYILYTYILSRSPGRVHASCGSLTVSRCEV